MNESFFANDSCGWKECWAFVDDCDDNVDYDDGYDHYCDDDHDDVDEHDDDNEYDDHDDHDHEDEDAGSGNEWWWQIEHHRRGSSWLLRWSWGGMLRGAAGFSAVFTHRGQPSDFGSNFWQNCRFLFSSGFSAVFTRVQIPSVGLAFLTKLWFPVVSHPVTRVVTAMVVSHNLGCACNVTWLHSCISIKIVSNACRTIWSKNLFRANLDVPFLRISWIVAPKLATGNLNRLSHLLFCFHLFCLFQCSSKDWKIGHVSVW